MLKKLGRGATAEVKVVRDLHNPEEVHAAKRVFLKRIPVDDESGMDDVEKMFNEEGREEVERCMQEAKFLMTVRD